MSELWQITCPECGERVRWVGTVVVCVLISDPPRIIEERVCRECAANAVIPPREIRQLLGEDPRRWRLVGGRWEAA